MDNLSAENMFESPAVGSKLIVSQSQPGPTECFIHAALVQSFRAASCIIYVSGWVSLAAISLASLPSVGTAVVFTRLALIFVSVLWIRVQYGTRFGDLWLPRDAI